MFSFVTHVVFTVKMMLLRISSFVLFRNPAALLQCLIEYVQNLPVGAAELVRSPLLYGIHGLGIDAQDKTFIFILFCQANRVLLV